MTDITEAELFEAILASEELPDYDPQKHLSATVAAARWGIDYHSAMERLSRNCIKFGLVAHYVRNPETGHRMKVFIPKRD